MILKKYRLKERELKKVLQRAKPFFSYGIVLNTCPNKEGFDRFGIVVGSKSVKDNVTRNFFRRRFYDKIREEFKLDSEKKGLDYVFVVKKQTKLDKNDENARLSFIKDLNFLINKNK